MSAAFIGNRNLSVTCLGRIFCSRDFIRPKSGPTKNRSSLGDWSRDPSMASSVQTAVKQHRQEQASLESGLNAEAVEFLDTVFVQADLLHSHDEE